MKHKIAISKARVHLGQIVKRVYLKHDTYLLEKNGIPLAAIVPPGKLRARKS